MVLEAIGEACGGPVAGASLPDYVHLARRELALDDPLGFAVCGRVGRRRNAFRWGGRTRGRGAGSGLFLSGSFNPLHEGHERLVAAAGQLSGRRASLELSIENVDKRPLQRSEVEERLKQMSGRFPVVMTRSPTFLQKAAALWRLPFCAGVRYGRAAFAGSVLR